MAYYRRRYRRRYRKRRYRRRNGFKRRRLAGGYDGNLDVKCIARLELPVNGNSVALLVSWRGTDAFVAGTLNLL